LFYLWRCCFLGFFVFSQRQCFSYIFSTEPPSIYIKKLQNQPINKSK
jgi:hypothetical protein